MTTTAHMTGNRQRTIARSVLAATALTLLATACGSDSTTSDAPTATSASPTTAAATTMPGMDHGSMPMDTSPDSTPAGSPASGVIAVTASDYAFTGIPARIAPRSTLTLTNSSTKEFHEMVVFHLPDTETRSVAELVAQGDEQLRAMFGDAMPAAVLLAPPGGAPQIAAVGDGTLTEPGRYMFVCTIPVGADPKAVAAAMSTDDDAPPPPVSDGPFHYMAGMWAEAVVG